MILTDEYLTEVLFEKRLLLLPYELISEARNQEGLFIEKVTIFVTKHNFEKLLEYSFIRKDPHVQNLYTFTKCYVATDKNIYYILETEAVETDNLYKITVESINNNVGIYPIIIKQQINKF